MYSCGDKLKAGRSSVSVPPKLAEPQALKHQKHIESNTIYSMLHSEQKHGVQTHLWFVEKEKLLFDLQEHRVKRELIGLLVQTRQGSASLGQ